MSSLSLSIRRFDSSGSRGIVRSFRLGTSIFTRPFLSSPTDRMSLRRTSRGTIVWNSKPTLSLNAGFASRSFSSSSLAPCFKSTSSCVGWSFTMKWGLSIVMTMSSSLMLDHSMCYVKDLI